ncbi:hypothetical protein BDQ12DRAFT_669341 [Crucibulum laeve]|uniref:Uncharacterized protein n=1 Tax=Crucibulum laeve TaxID=68775 RepID=A0A5C3LQK4_9AGAR|nr:hypothetical protein BDQ12DRAFT_669341 [Crucibulum laeve]
MHYSNPTPSGSPQFNPSEQDVQESSWHTVPRLALLGDSWDIANRIGIEDSGVRRAEMTLGFVWREVVEDGWDEQDGMSRAMKNKYIQALVFFSFPSTDRRDLLRVWLIELNYAWRYQCLNEVWLNLKAKVVERKSSGAEERRCLRGRAFMNKVNERVGGKDMLWMDAECRGRRGSQRVLAAVLQWRAMLISIVPEDGGDLRDVSIGNRLADEEMKKKRTQ